MILLDTNVISEFARPAPAPAVERWYLANAGECWLAAVALGEMAYGVAKLPPGAGRTRLELQLADWRIAYAARVHGFHASTAMIYGELMANARRAGRPMSTTDAQIAATASEHGLALATRNVTDFATTGLTLIDPWAH
ncbi:MAG: type II toxin-antitoxin system VapC family toxin [Sphingomonadaceae bacterium]